MTVEKGSVAKTIPLSLREGHESKLPEWAIQNEMTLYEIAKRLGVHTSRIYDLAYGKTSPVDLRSGKTRDLVVALSEFTGLEPHELFPRYFCPLRAAVEQADTRIQDCHYKAHDAEFVEEWLHARKIASLFDACPIISVEDKQLILQRFVYEDTIAELARVAGKSKTRVDQRISKIFRKFRHWYVNRFDDKCNTHVIQRLLIPDRAMKRYTKATHDYAQAHGLPVLKGNLTPSKVLLQLKQIQNKCKFEVPIFKSYDANTTIYWCIPFCTTRSGEDGTYFQSLVLSRTSIGKMWYGATSDTVVVRPPLIEHQCYREFEKFQQLTIPDVKVINSLFKNGFQL